MKSCLRTSRSASARGMLRSAHPTGPGCPGARRILRRSPPELRHCSGLVSVTRFSAHSAGASRHRNRIRQPRELCQTGATVRLPQGGARGRHRMRDKSNPDRRAVSPGDPIRRDHGLLSRRPGRQAGAARPGTSAMTTQRPARNRVSPLGEIIAVSGRGAWMGNRGRLHEGRATGTRNKSCATISTRRGSPACCRSGAGGCRSGSPTATRRCSSSTRPSPWRRDTARARECRHSAYITYRTLWAETHGGARIYAKDMDAQLHVERTDRAEHRAPWDSLPDGVFVATDRGPAVVVGEHLAVWDGDDNTYRNMLIRPTFGTLDGAHPAGHSGDSGRRLSRADR